MDLLHLELFNEWGGNALLMCEFALMPAVPIIFHVFANTAQDSYISNQCSVCMVSLMLLGYCECVGTLFLIQCDLGQQAEPGKSNEL